MKNNKKILGFLAAILLIVWGAIIYQILSAMFQSDENNGEDISKFENQAHSGKSFIYNADVRDPFRFYSPGKKDTIRKVFEKPLPIVLNIPQYRLTGIILNDKKRTAIVEGQDGTVSFLQEKDTLAGFKILKIKERQVIYTSQNRIAEWTLQ